MKTKVISLVRKNKLATKYLSYLKLLWHKYKSHNYNKFLETMEKYNSKENMRNRKYVSKIAKDAYFCNLFYKVTFREYFLYNFEFLSDTARKEFIGDIERKEMLEGYGDIKSREILSDKYKCYLKFKPFYKREIIKITGKDDKSIFEDFCKRYSSFIVKPSNLKQGIGIYKIDLKDFNSLNDVWAKINSGGVFKESVIEELVIQTEDLGKFHPSSINTIRFATYMKNNKLTELFAVLRMGQGGSVVDNASAGGIFAKINIETGIIDSYAREFKSRKQYIAHPDTQVLILGVQIPKWQELRQIVKTLAKSFPEYPYISFDFALTEKGWTMIEANERGGLDIYQLYGLGIRKAFEQ